MWTPELDAQLRTLGVSTSTARRVLLVDDEEENLEVLTAVLEDDYELLRAAGGREALDVLAEHGPVDLIVSDQRMPGLTGVELLEQVAQRWPDTIRIVLTAYSDVTPMIDAINRGAVHRFLLKPFSVDEMLAVVADGLSMKSAADALRLVVEALAQRRAELSRALEEQQQAEAQLLAAERICALGRLSSGIVHDLRNQMAMMSAVLGIVRDAYDDPEILRSAELARQRLDAYMCLVQQVRDYARVHAQSPSPGPVETSEFLMETVAMHAMDPLTERSPVNVLVDPGLERLTLDEARMRQALLALLRNAALASPPGAEVDLLVAHSPGGGARMEVRDRGCGMPPETLERATEPFFSAFRPSRLGLGLEIARLGAHAHGGTLEIEAPAGGGLVARIELGAQVLARGST